MFIPLKDLNPRREYPYVNTALILINILVFIYQLTLSPRVFKAFVLANATVPSRFPAALHGHGHLEAAVLPAPTTRSPGNWKAPAGAPDFPTEQAEEPVLDGV